VGASLGLIGCQPEGPAERAGEHLDRAAEEIREAADPRTTVEQVEDGLTKAARTVEDAISPPGPAEKLGRAIDDASKAVTPQP
jgi:hypothetical protein